MGQPERGGESSTWGKGIQGVVRAIGGGGKGDAKPPTFIPVFFGGVFYGGVSMDRSSFPLLLDTYSLLFC